MACIRIDLERQKRELKHARKQEELKKAFSDYDSLHFTDMRSPTSRKLMEDAYATYR
jgi:hypothetical protein